MSDTSSLVGFVIPAAIGAACSPTILVVSTGILSGSRRPRRRATAFWLGGIGALLIWAAIVYSALWTIFQQTATTLAEHASQIEVVLGILLLVVGTFALLEWRRILTARQRHQGGASREDRSPDGLLGVGVLGAVMEGRDISSMILYIAILSRVASAAVPLVEKVAITAMAMAIVTLPYWLPLLTHVTIPTSFRRRAAPVREWLADHSQAVTVSVCLLLGIFLVGHALLQ